MTHNNVADRIRQLKQYREQLASDYLIAKCYGDYDMADDYERALREIDEQLSEAIEEAKKP